VYSRNVHSRNALSAWFFAVDRALNSYFMIIIMIMIDCGNLCAMLSTCFVSGDNE